MLDGTLIQLRGQFQISFHVVNPGSYELEFSDTAFVKDERELFDIIPKLSSRILVKLLSGDEALKGLLEKRPLGALRRFTIEEGGKFGWQAASDSFFRKSVTPGGVLLDIGVHVLDLLLWWLDEPATLRYKDDAMGGQEANCRLELNYADGVQGEVRLSRDWPTRDGYTFFFERGIVRYHVNDANRLEITADGMPAPLDGRLQHQPRGLARTNPQSFINNSATSPPP